MICFPNAKINLGLNIVSKREDGYHNLETIFYPINIYDVLEIISNNRSEDRLFIGGISLDTKAEENLVMKAVKLLRNNYDFPCIDIHLLKKIPFGAGIGGGSSDAAHMLKLVNSEFSLNITNIELKKLAVKLGADCPFFIDNKAAYAEGIGEELEPIELDLSAYEIVLVKPDIFVSTKDAFSLVKPQTPKYKLIKIIEKPVEEWKSLMINDFELSVSTKYTEIKDIKNQLYTKGALYASMTGSGPSVFGIFRKNTQFDLDFGNAEIYKNI